jgi:hypothetical protein
MDMNKIILDAMSHGHLIPKYWLFLSYGKEFPKDGRKIKRNLYQLFTYIKGSGNWEGLDNTCKMVWKLTLSKNAPKFCIIVQTKLEFNKFVNVCREKWLKIIKDDDIKKIKCNHFSDDEMSRYYYNIPVTFGIFSEIVGIVDNIGHLSGELGFMKK